MAKCLICNSRKGKRKCIARNGFICSQCCGQARSSDECAGCLFHRDEKSLRNYRNVPYYSLSEMSHNRLFQDRTEVIESAICRFDSNNSGMINDQMAHRIVELLLDRYHFQDEEIAFSNPVEEKGFAFVNQAIQKHLAEIPPAEISQLLGTISRSINRHNESSRAYLEFIHQYVMA